MQKISDILGVQLQFGNPIDHDKQLPGTFLSYLDKDSCSYTENRLYKAVVEEGKNNEEAYYYYLALVSEMNMKG
jgi:hypothetical protein